MVQWHRDREVVGFGSDLAATNFFTKTIFIFSVSAEKAGEKKNDFSLSKSGINWLRMTFNGDKILNALLRTDT